MSRSAVRVLRAALALALPLLLATCGSSSHLSGLGISPISPTIDIGGHEQFTATAHYDNGPDQDVTSSATWTSANMGVATISKGVAIGVTAGTSNINASFSQGSSTVQAGTDLTVAQ
jgi:hypothetical protein